MSYLARGPMFWMGIDSKANAAGCRHGMHFRVMHVDAAAGMARVNMVEEAAK